MGLFDKFKSKSKKANPEIGTALKKASDVKTTHLRSTTYPIKILVAWGEAIDGNKDLRGWLIKNGYPELGVFYFALRNEDSAQDWLMKMGYPHLVALIKGIEGDPKALHWLKSNNFEILWHMALAADGNVDSKRFLLMADKVYAALSNKMERVKDNIDWNNNSIHSINP